MKKFVYILPLILVCAGFAQQLSNESYPATGLTLQHYTSPEPWSIYVLKINLDAPGITLKAAKANQHLFSLATTSAIAEFNHTPEEPVLAAINADFFHSSGMPTGGMASQGVVLKPPIKHSVFGLRSSGKPFIDVIDLESWILDDGNRVAIDGYNLPRTEDQTVVYNRYYGRSTRTNSWGNEYFLKYLVGRPC